MIEQILFVLLAIITLGSALVVVTNRNLFHAALALMVSSFAGVAGIYITLDAGFLAMAQLLVYIGAISILIIFAIMMTRRLMQAVEDPFQFAALAGSFRRCVTLLVLAVVIDRYWPLKTEYR